MHAPCRQGSRPGAVPSKGVVPLGKGPSEKDVMAEGPLSTVAGGSPGTIGQGKWSLQTNTMGGSWRVRTRPGVRAGVIGKGRVICRPRLVKGQWNADLVHPV